MRNVKFPADLIENVLHGDATTLLEREQSDQMMSKSKRKGMRRPPSEQAASPLVSASTVEGKPKKLLKAWRKASAAERAAFLREVRSQLPSPADAAPASGDGSRGIADGRYLLAPAKERILAVMLRRRLSAGAVMSELGFPDDGLQLARALQRGSSLRLAVIAAIVEWLPSQETRSEQCTQEPPSLPPGLEMGKQEDR